MKLDPASAESRVAYSRLLLAQGDIARAERLVDEALKLAPASADDRSIATMLGVTRGDVEAIFRHLQHAVGS